MIIESLRPRNTGNEIKSNQIACRNCFLEEKLFFHRGEHESAELRRDSPRNSRMSCSLPDGWQVGGEFDP